MAALGRPRCCARDWYWIVADCLNGRCGSRSCRSPRHAPWSGMRDGAAIHRCS